MKTSYVKRILGYTVIELMIVLIIVALLLALAYPSYTQYVRKARRGDAQQMLLNWSINQEIWRSNHTAYALAADIPVPVDPDGYYAFPDPDPTITATTYTLTANAQNDQTKDKSRDGTPCTSLTLNQNGVKEPAVCWD